MWEQFAAIAWLKMRVVRRGMLKTSGALAAVLAALVAFGAALAAVGLSIGAFAAGALADLSGQGGVPVLAVADAFTFFFCMLWLASVLSEIQRSDVVDLRKMLFLPVSLKGVFAINFAFSLLSPIGALFVLPALAFVAGLAVQYGPRMLLAVFSIAAFYAAMAAWTYYLQGILAMIMQDKRRRRRFVMLLPFLIMLIVWVPQLLLRAAPRWMPGDPETALMALNVALPPGWLPLAIHGLLLRDVHTAFACTMGLAGIAFLPLSMAYRSTRRFYMGESKPLRKKTDAKKGKAEPAPLEGLMVARSLPGFDEETSAIAAATFKMLVRHPAIRMQLIAPFFIAVFFLAFIWLRSESGLEPPDFLRRIIPTLALAWPLLNAATLSSNIFGTDGHGFRMYMLLPTDRRKYFLGKNLAAAPLYGGQMALFVILTAAFLGSGVSAAATGLLGVAWAFLATACIGNVASMFLPYRMASDSLRGPANKSAAFLMAFLFLAMLPFVMLPPLVSAGIDPALEYLLEGWRIPAGPILGLLFVGLAVLVYRWNLDFCGSTLSKREGKVLEAVTKGD